MVRRIALASVSVAKGEAAPVDECGERVFDAIDRDGDGLITRAELVSYMLTEYGGRAAHGLLRVLDSDANASISRTEWRTGWQTGLVTKYVMEQRKGSTAPATAEPTVGQGRLGGRRANVGLGGEMTAAVAATLAPTIKSESTSSAGGKKGKGKAKAE